MSASVSVIHVLHILAAGVWLGGLVFTAAVVTPAFKRMGWSDAERMAVRSEVGRQYSKIARLNLVALLALAVATWWLSGGAIVLAEVALIAIVIVLSELHAFYFAPRLARAAREKRDELRRSLLRLSVSVSMLNLLLSVAIMVLAAWRTV